jgi:hypothetical protein
MGMLPNITIYRADIASNNVSTNEGEIKTYLNNKYYNYLVNLWEEDGNCD